MKYEPLRIPIKVWPHLSQQYPKVINPRAVSNVMVMISWFWHHETPIEQTLKLSVSAFGFRSDPSIFPYSSFPFTNIRNWNSQEKEFFTFNLMGKISEFSDIWNPKMDQTEAKKPENKNKKILEKILATWHHSSTMMCQTQRKPRTSSKSDRLWYHEQNITKNVFCIFFSLRLNL